jgi:hypothetical protein
MLSNYRSILQSFCLIHSGIRCASSADIARLLANKYPSQDPRALKESRIQTFLSALPADTVQDIKIASVHSAWKDIYEAKLHDTAFDEAADPGELCDGELNSWRNDRLRVEKDKNASVPSVSAHEARIEQARTKKQGTD